MSTNAAPSQTSPQAPQPYGEVFDRGYQHYTGPRGGRRQAFRSLVGYSIKRAMGIRKSWTAKILPFLLYVSALVPLIVIIGINAFVPQAGLFTYPGYLSGIFIILGIFVATTAPEMLCVDRRERTLPLYFARAITRFDYVLAKFAAMAILTMTLSVLPAIILWLGTQLTADAPGSAMVDNLDDLWRVTLAGLLVALFLGGGGLAISSLTSRKGVAVAVIIVGTIVLTGVVQTSFLLLSDYEWRRYLIFLSPSDTFNGLLDGLFGEDDFTNTFAQIADFSVWVYVAYMLGIALLSLLFVRWRYAPRDDES